MARIMKLIRRDDEDVKIAAQEITAEFVTMVKYLIEHPEIVEDIIASHFDNNTNEYVEITDMTLSTDSLSGDMSLRVNVAPSGCIKKDESNNCVYVSRKIGIV